MTLPRRFLPPTPWLTAFEAVARLGSVTQAAAELDLTQGAVSRQVQKLEDGLQVPLFERAAKRLTLTGAGEIYASEIRAGLAQIGNATVALRANPSGGVLELAILPAFGTHWLAPRLPGFLSRHPGVTIKLGTRTAPFAFAAEKFHAAIHFGQDGWPGSQSLRLMEEQVVPVLAPSLAQNPDLATLTRAPLLQLETRADAWPRWFAAQGMAQPFGRGMEFDQFATMLQAAVFGLGAALMPLYLVERDIAEGRLVVPRGVVPLSLGAYFLVWPTTRAQHPPLIAFRDWIAAQVLDSGAEPGLDGPDGGRENDG